WRIYGTRTG
ncbi:antirestriction family protein, partial [Escherichia coli FDA506]